MSESKNVNPFDTKAMEAASQESVALAKQEDAAVSALLGSMANDFQGAVVVRKELIRVPKIKLSQSGSPAVKSGLVSAGEFYCDVKSANYGNKIEFTPIHISESASYMRKDEIICSSRDLIHNRDGILCKNCPHGKYWGDWGTKDNKKIPDCKTSINIIGLIGNDPIPVLFSFRKTSSKAGREILNKVVHSVVPFQFKYVISSKPESDGQNDYFVINPLMEKHPLSLDELKVVNPIARKVLESIKRGEVDQDVDESDDSESARHSNVPL